MLQLPTWAVENVDSGILTVAVEIGRDKSLEKPPQLFIFPQSDTSHCLCSTIIDTACT